MGCYDPHVNISLHELSLFLLVAKEDFEASYGC